MCDFVILIRIAGICLGHRTKSKSSKYVRILLLHLSLRGLDIADHWITTQPGIRSLLGICLFPVLWEDLLLQTHRGTKGKENWLWPAPKCEDMVRRADLWPKIFEG